MTSSRSTDRSARSSSHVPLSRADLRRALVLNALVHPVNVLVPTGVLVAGVLIGATWLVIVAAVCWLALSAMTFFDEREAARLGERRRAARRPAEPAMRVDPATFAPAIRARVRGAAAACASIREAIAASPTPLADVEQEVQDLLAAIQTDAQRAQRIHEFLAEESPTELERRVAQEPRAQVRTALEAKLAALTRLRVRLDGLLSEMDHVVTTLQIVQAEILAHDGVEHALEQRALASQVSELRDKVRILATGLEETFAETRVHEVSRDEV
jgi:hypothetical protein